MALNRHNTNGESVKDLYKQEAYFQRCYDRIDTFHKKDIEIVKQYIQDMQKGRNISGKKGERGYIHLNTLISRLNTLGSIVQDRHKKALIDLTADQAHNIFSDMKTGKILKKRTVRGKKDYALQENVGPYKSTHDYIKIFKAFWHWYMKVQRRQGITVPDIVEDLSGSSENKPDFVYFTQGSLKQMMNKSKYENKVLMLFLFDSGVRVTEAMNVKGKDIDHDSQQGIVYLNIRDETSKTFGRKIKLMLCKEMILEYIKSKKIGKEDYLFDITPYRMNEYLKRLSFKVFGNDLEGLKEHKKSKKYITLYDFRHSSACYWLPRYRQESALKYRFGWKTSDMIHYYTEFLGMKDTIEEEDMLIDVTKTQLEKEIAKERQARLILEDQVRDMQKNAQIGMAALSELKETMNELKEINDKYDRLRKYIRKDVKVMTDSEMKAKFEELTQNLAENK